MIDSSPFVYQMPSGGDAACATADIASIDSPATKAGQRAVGADRGAWNIFVLRRARAGAHCDRGLKIRLAETEGFEPSIGLYNPITV